jgi:HAD superfamily hydrolase (TIGR01549 family)
VADRQASIVWGGERLEPSAIRAVLFDFDGTLYAQLPLRIAMAGEMAIASAGTLFSRGPRVPRVIATFRKTRERLRNEPHGEPDGKPPIVTRQYTAVAETLSVSPAEVERIVDEWMYRRPLKWLKYCRRRGLVDVLDWLELRGLRKGVLSDYPAVDKLAALGLAGRFDPVVSATDPDVNALKPNPRGYVAAARRWDLDPSEILYVGDRIEVDAAGARAAGMPCAVLTRRVSPGVIAIRTLSELKTILDPAL